MTPIQYFKIIFFGIKQIMEEDILNLSPTVIFRGIPCISKYAFC